MTINQTTGEEFTLPDHEQVVQKVAEVARGWFPEATEESCTNFAFHLVHQVLTVRPVGGGVYSLYLGAPPG